VKYSCFNDRLRLYEVFEDRRGHAVNGDLPAPVLPAEAGGIGVPAVEAARPLPRGIRRAGTSWSPQGIIVRCKNTKVEGLGEDAGKGCGRLLLAAAAWVAVGAVVAHLWYNWRAR
jgi:hypothetical protein